MFLICVMLLSAALSAPAQIPQTMSYQGVLTDGAGTPVSDGTYSITFRLYPVSTGGTAVWTEAQSIDVSGGIFSAILGAVNPLAVPFDQPYWLALSVNGGAEYSPRTELTATGYSLNTQAVADSAVTGAGIASGTVVRSLSGLSDDVILAAGSNVSITASGDTLIVSSSGGGGSLDWSLTGNAGTTPGVNFIGTTDNQPLELWANNARLLRLEPHATSPNIVGGRSINAVTAGAFGATISGGGAPTNPNTATDNHGTVAGGKGNTAGDDDGDPANAAGATVGGGEFNRAAGEGATVSGGSGNTASGVYAAVGGGVDNAATGLTATVGGGDANQATGTDATVGGGASNLATAQTATVGGGNGNDASGQSSTVAGGNNNEASGTRASVGGGNFNVASGLEATLGGGNGNQASGAGSTIPGGENNIAGGGYSFAAGRGAQALHGGAFVWSDSGGDNGSNTFASTGPDQFLIRAAGGVGIGTNTPQQELDVAGSVRMQGFDLPTGGAAGYVLTSDAQGSGSWQPAPGGSAWGLTGNAGTNPTTDFLGTTDNQPLEIHVNDTRAYRIEPTASVYRVNVVGGSFRNNVVSGVEGATIGGGGGEGNTSPNVVADDYGTIAGGGNNTAGIDDGFTNSSRYATIGGGSLNIAGYRHSTIGGGQSNQTSGVRATIGGGQSNNAFQDGSVAGGTDNTASIAGSVGGGVNNWAGASHTTVGGGQDNTAGGNYGVVAGGNSNSASGAYSAIGGGLLCEASADWAFVGGGDRDTASGMYATVPGGRENVASANYATVAGGLRNSASGTLSTVIGGNENTAGGIYSVACGRRAKVNSSHGGAFLFADMSDFDFNSLAGNEFAVRAIGGVRFVSAIDGSGNATAGVELTAGSGTWSSLSDRDAKENITPVDGVAILEKLEQIEISTWSYRAEDPSVRHMGPMAQDFYLAFELGTDDRHITTVDADGVSLAAIQALNRKLENEVKKKDAAIAALEARIAALEAMFARMAGTPIVTK
jgi:hypothetical protein